MPEVARKLLGFLEAVSTPAAVRRLDRRTVSRMPLLWRSRLIPVAWYSLLGCLVLSGLGSIPWMTPSSAWNTTQVEGAFSILRFACLGAIVWWFLQQIQIRVGDLGLREHARLAAFNLCTVFLFLLPPHALVIAATHQIAGVMGDAEFQEHWNFHSGWGFWSGDQLGPQVEEAFPQLRVSARRFGVALKDLQLNYELESFYRIPDNDYCESDPCVLSVDYIEDAVFAVGPAIYSRLNSIKRSKEMLEGRGGHYFSTYILSIKENIGLGLLSAIIVGVSSLPKYKWQYSWLRSSQRHFASGVLSKPVRAGRLPIPAWLRRIDRELLRNRPMLWATNAHIFIFHALTLGLVLISICAVLSWIFLEGHLIEIFASLFGRGSLLFLAAPILLGAAGPTLWAAVSTDRHIPAYDKSKRRALVSSYFIASLPIPVLTIVAALASGLLADGEDRGDTLFLLIFVYCGVVAVVSWCLVRNYSNKRMAHLTTLLPFLVLYGLFFSMLFFLFELDEAYLTIIFIMPLATWGLLNFLWSMGGKLLSAKRWPMTRIILSIGCHAFMLFFQFLILWFFLLGYLQLSTDKAGLTSLAIVIVWGWLAFFTILTAGLQNLVDLKTLPRVE